LPSRRDNDRPAICIETICLTALFHFLSLLDCNISSFSHTNTKMLTSNSIQIASDHNLIVIPQVEQNPVKMPYTALQTLGYLARCSNWERIYNINRAPHRKAKTTACKLYAYRAKYKKSGRKVLVLKRTGPRKIACGCSGCCICGKFVGEL
jgi:hypothetical protein